MVELGYLVAEAVAHLPEPAVLLVGLVLLAVARGRLPGRARALALAGVGVLLFGILLNSGSPSRPVTGAAANGPARDPARPPPRRAPTGG